MQFHQSIRVLRQILVDFQLYANGRLIYFIEQEKDNAYSAHHLRDSHLSSSRTKKLRLPERTILSTTKTLDKPTAQRTEQEHVYYSFFKTAFSLRARRKPAESKINELLFRNVWIVKRIKSIVSTINFWKSAD